MKKADVDILELLAEIERLEKQVAALRGALALCREAFANPYIVGSPQDFALCSSVPVLADTADVAARFVDIDGEAMNDLLDECINAATSPCNESSAEVIARVIAEHKAKGGAT